MQTIIGNLIKTKRIEAKLTQLQLAELIGMDNSQYISNIERGMCVVSPKYMLGISRVIKKLKLKTIREAAIQDFTAKLDAKLKQ